MIRRNETRVEIIARYVITVLLIYMSGSIFFISFNYSKAVIAVLAASLIVAFIRNRLSMGIRSNAIIMIAVFCISMGVTVLTTGENNTNSYIAIGLQMVTALTVAATVDYQSFKRTYIKIMFVLASISIVAFAVSQIYPNIIYYFKKTDAIASLCYYNAYVYIFPGVVGYSRDIVFNRNLGIFWEPGAYQAFLNLALLFLLDGDEKIFSNRTSKMYLAVFVFTIFTTFSTTGYLVLALIAVAYWNKIKKDYFKNSISFEITILLIILASIIANKYGFQISDFNMREKVGTGNAYNRLTLDQLSYISLLGISFSKYYAQELFSGNSILHTFICLGCIFGSVLIYGYIRYVFKMTKKPIISLAALMMCFSSESLIWRPIFLYLIFSSFYDTSMKARRRERGQNENSYNKLRKQSREYREDNT